MAVTRYALLLLTMSAIVTGRTATAWATPSQTVPPAHPQQVFVDIVAVTEFNDPKYAEDSPLLPAAYADVASKLESFFKGSVKGAVVKLHTTAADTTYAAVQSLLYGTMAQRVNSINLLFILSHGTAEHFPHSQLSGRDLFIALSDTATKNVRGTALPASALLAAFSHFPASSSTFVFIDTCFSGAVSNAGVTLNQALWKFMGVNLMLLVSSGAYEQSYNAMFTQALLDEWSQAADDKRCVSGDGNIAETLAAQIRNRVTAETWEILKQDIRLVVPYFGDFCLDSLSKHGSLLLLRNPTNREFRVVLRSSDGTREKKKRLEARSILPMKLDRSLWILETLDTQPPAVPATITLDMDRFPLRPLSVGIGTDFDAEVESQLLAESADWAARVGAAPGEVQELRLKSLGVLAAKVGRNIPQTRLAEAQVFGETDLSPVISFVAPYARQLATGEAITKLAKQKGLDLGEVAINLGYAGRFRESAKLCQDLLANAPQEQEKNLASCAYLGWSAAGEIGEAKRLYTSKKAMLSDCPECVAVAAVTEQSGAAGGGAGMRVVMDKVKY